MHPTETDESRSQSLFLFVYLVNVLHNIHIITPILFILFRIIVSISYTNDYIHRIPFLDITSDIKRLRAQHLGFPRRYALCVIPHRRRRIRSFCVVDESHRIHRTSSCCLRRAIVTSLVPSCSLRSRKQHRIIVDYAYVDARR